MPFLFKQRILSYFQICVKINEINILTPPIWPNIFFIPLIRTDENTKQCSPKQSECLGKMTCKEGQNAPNH